MTKKKTPETGARLAGSATFAVPADAFGRLGADCRFGRGVKATPATVRVGELLDVDAVVVAAKTPRRAANVARRLIAALGAAETAGFVSCTRRGKVVPYLVPFAPNVVLHDDAKQKDKDLRADETREFLTIAEKFLFPYLENLSQVTATEVHFHHSGSIVREPFPEKAGVVHLFDNAGPPGEFRTRYQSMAFETSIDIGFGVLSRTASKGRGTVLKDKDSEMVQVEGSNLYLLIPSFTRFRFTQTITIFRHLLALAWAGRREERRLKPARTHASRSAFVNAASGWIGAYREEVRTKLKDKRETVRKLQEELAETLSKIRELEIVDSAFGESSVVQEALRRLPDDYRRIVSMPRVARVAIVEDGLHVETDVIVAEHAGVRRPLGSYVVRIGGRGGVCVWGKMTFHPDRVPHPHIGKDGSPCFGNAVEAIEKFAAHQRYADAVALVLRWLERGYTPELAEVKIEEWPEAGAREAPAAAADTEVRHG